MPNLRRADWTYRPFVAAEIHGKSGGAPTAWLANLLVDSGAHYTMFRASEAALFDARGTGKATAEQGAIAYDVREVIDASIFLRRWADPAGTGHSGFVDHVTLRHIAAKAYDTGENVLGMQELADGPWHLHWRPHEEWGAIH